MFESRHMPKNIRHWDKNAVSVAWRKPQARGADCSNEPTSSIWQPRCHRFPLRPVALRPFLSKGVPFSNVGSSLHNRIPAVNFAAKFFPDDVKLQSREIFFSVIRELIDEGVQCHVVVPFIFSYYIFLFAGCAIACRLCDRIRDS